MITGPHHIQLISGSGHFHIFINSRFLLLVQQNSIGQMSIIHWALFYQKTIKIKTCMYFIISVFYSVYNLNIFPEIESTCSQ